MADTRAEMTFEEARAFVLAFLADGARRTTDEVAAATQKVGKRCPDSTVRFLSRLRLLGLIRGELSPADRGWVWWRAPAGGAPG